VRKKGPKGTILYHLVGGEYFNLLMLLPADGADRWHNAQVWAQRETYMRDQGLYLHAQKPSCSLCGCITLHVVQPFKIKVKTIALFKMTCCSKQQMHHSKWKKASFKIKLLFEWQMWMVHLLFKQCGFLSNDAFVISNSAFLVLNDTFVILNATQHTIQNEKMHCSKEKYAIWMLFETKNTPTCIPIHTCMDMCCMVLEECDQVAHIVVTVGYAWCISKAHAAKRKGSYAWPLSLPSP